MIRVLEEDSEGGNIDEKPWEDLNLQSDSEEEIISKASEGEDEIQASNSEGEIPDPAPNLIEKDGLIWHKVPFIQSRTRRHNIIKWPIDKVIFPPGYKVVKYMNTEAKRVRGAGHGWR